MTFVRTILLLAAALLAATGAHAQVQYRDSEQGNSGAGGPGITHVNPGASSSRNNCGAVGTPLTGAGFLPAGRAAGDILITLVLSRESSATITGPGAGWTQIYTNTPATDFEMYVYYRIATNTAADNFSFSQAGTCSSLAAQMSAFRGVDNTNPFEFAATIPASSVAFANAGDLDTGTETTYSEAAMTVVAGFIMDDRTVTQGAGWSQSFDSALNLTRDLGISLHYQLQTASGVKGSTTLNWDLSGAGTDNRVGIVFSLRPAGELRIAVPAATQANDVMIASVTYRPCSNTSGGACTTTITAPAAWTLVNSIDQTTGGGTGGYGNRVFIYRRTAAGPPGAGEPDYYSWFFGGAPVHAGAAGGIISFSAVDTSDPIIAEAGQTTASGGAPFTHSAPSINAPNGSMLVSTHTANSSGTWSPPATMTERADASSLPPNDDLGLSIEVNHELFAAGGATGTRDAVLNGPPPANDAGATHMLALRPALSHYAISALATTVANCDYAEITITGHAVNHSAAAPRATRIVTLSVSAGGATAVWQPTLVSGAGIWTPSGGSTATYQWSGGETSFAVRLRQSAVVSLSVNLLDNFGTAEDGTEDPGFSFVDSAFRISNGSNASLAIGNQISGKPSNAGFGTQDLYLQAVRTDVPTGACTSVFPNGSEVDVEVGAICNNPATCTRNVTLATQATGGSPSGTFAPGAAGTYPATIRFAFTTANAEAPFNFSYADAGQITLQFRYVTAAPAVTIAGTGGPFVVRPFGIAFRGANAATPIQHGTTATDPLLAAAGDNFTMTLAAYQWAAGQDVAPVDGFPDFGGTDVIDITGNGDTPNFAWDTGVGVYANLPGVAAGTVTRGVGCAGGATVTAAQWSGGTATITDWCYNEAGNVGLFSLTSNYIAAGITIIGVSSYDGSTLNAGHVGRFRPKQFALSAGSVTTRAAAGCSPDSTFTYLDERLDLGFTLTAQNTQGGTTLNYDGAYAKLDLSAIGNLNLGARSGATNLTSRVNTGAGSSSSGSWSNGVASGIAVQTAIQRLTASPFVDGPYAGLAFGVAPSDSDSVAMDTLDLDVDNNSVDDHKSLGVTTEVRFGRLRLQNASGGQNLDLPIPIQTQFWNGTVFATNTVDNCTSLSAANLSLGSYTNGPGGIDATNMGDSHISLGGAFAAGVGSLKLTKPSPAATIPGGTTLTVDLAAEGKTYLQGAWTGAPYDDNPSARATWGLYGSQPQNFIYFRENY